MYFKFIRPGGFLSQYINHYWVMEIDASEGNIRERIIPKGSVELMFHYKKPFVVTHSDNHTTIQPTSILSGISNSYSDVSTRGNSGVIAVSFNAWSACCFFGFPLSKVENDSVHLCDVFSNEIKFVEEQIGEAKNLETRIAIIEKFLYARFTPVPTNDYRLIRECILQIKSNEEIQHAHHLSENFDISPRKLERKFSAYVGISPKQFIRIERFKKTILAMSTSEITSLTGCAYDNGYFDQSNFIKEFKTFTGYTPSEYREQLANCSTSPTDMAREFDL
ncbi:MAG TPA: helix-turn-helix domain-containing protein [Prolixibacteraceae bacterium]|nr:helix-turn-helix domain-containing protein [Prolixibacteraceae bacterium]